jgi:hypothetical protein
VSINEIKYVKKEGPRDIGTIIKDCAIGTLEVGIGVGLGYLTVKYGPNTVEWLGHNMGPQLGAMAAVIAVVSPAFASIFLPYDGVAKMLNYELEEDAEVRKNQNYTKSDI